MNWFIKLSYFSIRCTPGQEQRQQGPPKLVKVIVVDDTEASGDLGGGCGCCCCGGGGTGDIPLWPRGISRHTRLVDDLNQSVHIKNSITHFHTGDRGCANFEMWLRLWEEWVFEPNCLNWFLKSLSVRVEYHSEFPRNLYLRCGPGSLYQIFIELDDI